MIYIYIYIYYFRRHKVYFSPIPSILNAVLKAANKRKTRRDKL